MTAPNASTLWGRVVVDELAKAGVDTVCVAPGSRSTPLTVAFAEHPGVQTLSHLDERSAAFFALGRAKRTGRATPLVCTSGTALANFHPAVVEADAAGVPLLLLTADRPPELRDSGANQTVDQEKFYGDAVRHYRRLPEPEPAARKLRSLRTALARAVATAEHERGPVHLDVPFRKPLEPTVDTGAVPDDFAERHPLAVEGRDGPFVTVTAGTSAPDDAALDRLAADAAAADRGLLVAGPSDALDATAAAAFARATGWPVLADPLSGVRFGPHVDDGAPVCGGYDAYVQTAVPDPDLVVRVGASPTSKPLRQFLRDADCRQVVVAPDGWPEAEFTATDLVVADSSRTLDALASRVTGRREATDGASGDRRTAWRDRFARLERDYWSLVDVADDWEGGVVADALALAPDPATLFVSNSMPVRDLDRFGRPRNADLTVLGNRGASGIDGITSTALGAGSATDDPLVLVTGDLAYYHDMNGLLAVGRCDVDATIVLVNNDGGGIFHALPIEAHDTFEDQFRTPHGLDFEPSADLYGLSFARVDDRAAFRERYRESLEREGTQVIEVRTDAGASHRFRERLQERVRAELGEG
ncbi:MAG: 2-succinyl-5-enolpyruvyl-6-hydroxy-3-cyclohexene-1-carboxylic-acid synthase [Haloarculaceae archaeon]